MWRSAWRIVRTPFGLSRGSRVIAGFGRRCPSVRSVRFVVGRISGVRVHRWALIGSFLWGMSASTFLAYTSLFDWGPGSSYVPAKSSIIAFIFCGIGGVILGVLDSFFEELAKKRALLLLALLMFAPRAWSQSSGDGDLDAAARAALAKAGRAEDSFREEAVKRLGKTQVIYAYQRVEIRGILSPKGPDSDTNGTFPMLFDKEIAPTHVKEGQPLPVWLKAAEKDLAALNKDAHNQLSNQFGPPSAPDKSQRIVAHGWGRRSSTAILMVLSAPRRRSFAECRTDLAKWKSSANIPARKWSYIPIRMTLLRERSESLAVRWRRLSYVACRWQCARRGWEGIVIPTPNQMFDEQWAPPVRSAGLQPHRRKPLEKLYKSVYKRPTHDRLEYYGPCGAGDLPSPRRVYGTRTVRRLRGLQTAQDVARGLLTSSQHCRRLWGTGRSHTPGAPAPKAAQSDCRGKSSI